MLFFMPSLALTLGRLMVLMMSLLWLQGMCFRAHTVPVQAFLSLCINFPLSIIVQVSLDIASPEE